LNIEEFNTKDDQCLLMIKCAVTINPTCKSLGILLDDQTKSIAYAYGLCQNRTLINYASGIQFISPFIRAYYIPLQLKLTVALDFFALMTVRVPGKFCLIGEHICQGINVTHNGSICFTNDEIFAKNYSFPPYEHLFCQLENGSIDYCMNTTFFYRCPTTGECISKHRLFDGFPDCLDLSDEQDLKAINSLEPLFQKDRYNCTIDGSQSSAVMRYFLGRFLFE
jgi:hypothetical protein